MEGSMIAHVPEVFVTCEECCGEGQIEQHYWTWEDPNFCKVEMCKACDGIGGFICEAA